MSEPATHPRIALITGANEGTGRAAAEQLAAQGVTVLVRQATHGADGSFGGFFSEEGSVPWWPSRLSAESQFLGSGR